MTLWSAQTATTRMVSRVVESGSNVCLTACTWTAIPHSVPASNAVSNADQAIRPKSSQDPISANPAEIEDFLAGGPVK